MSAVNAAALLAAAGGDYTISRSVRMRSSASAYLNRTSGTPTSKDVWTYSGWVKYSTGKYCPLLYALSGGFYEFFEIDSTNTFFWITRNSAGTVFKQYYTAAGQRLFRDPSAWYHFVIRKTSALTLQFYVNGEEFSLTAQTVGSPSSSINTASTAHYIGYEGFGGVYADCYLTEVNFIDGQALTPSSFGETDAITGVWKPKKYAGTYGTNGFYLNFADNSNNTAATIGKDSSGNGNNWTPNNISVTSGVTYDSMLDTPTPYADGGNGRGNYCTLNPISFNSSYCVDGNLAYAGANGTSTRASFAMPSTGKWYWEITPVNASPNYVGFGLMDTTTNGGNTAGSAAAGVWGFYPTTNMWYSINGTATNSGIATPALGCTFAVAFDSDTGKFWLGYAASGAGSITWLVSGNPSSGTSPIATISMANLLFPFMSSNNTTSDKSAINFGQRPFAYTPPTGFKALNTQNLPDSTIKKGNQYFDATTYTGNASTLAVTNAGFQPDLVWMKNRASAYSHGLYDSVRGAGTTKGLYSNETAAEGANSTLQNLVSFDSSGFTLGSTSSTNVINTSGQSHVAWQWKESASAGFDIVTYTGNGANRTIAHSLGVAPSMMIFKVRSTTNNWLVYHRSVGATGYLLLDSTAATATSALAFNNTAPTSTDFTLSTGGAVNSNTQTYVAYLFSEVAGYSKFGSYTGNGSADGPFVYLGFRPRFIMVKRTDSSTYGNWEMIDTARDSYNQVYLDLSANLSAAENATDGASWDILSNGFKCRDGSSTGNKNVSGGTYIYAAFAEVPTKYSLAR